MQTGEAVRMQTQALMREAEELSAESRQQGHVWPASMQNFSSFMHA
jgi:hypothetical protein